MMQIIQWNPSECHPEIDAKYTVESLWLPPWNWCKVYSGTPLTATLKMMQSIQWNPSDRHPENDANCTVEPLTTTLKMKQNGLDSVIVVL